MLESSRPFSYYHDEQACKEALLLRSRITGVLPSEEDAKKITGQEACAEVSLAKGLALSGGGIRSATFNLGLQRALAQAGLLKKFGFLSTVSGGGYIGGFLGRLFHRASEEASVCSSPTSVAADVERVLASDAAPVIRWLRDHGRYLAPRGFTDKLFAAGIYLRNLLAIHVMVGMTLLAVFLACAALRILAQPLLACLNIRGDFWEKFGYLRDGGGLSPLWLVVMATSLLVLASAWAYWLHRDKLSTAMLERLIALLVGVAATAALAGDMPALVPITSKIARGILVTAAIAGFGAFLIAAVVGLDVEGLGGIRNRLSVILRSLLLLLLASAALAALDDLAYRLLFSVGRANATDTALFGAGATGAILAVLRGYAQAASTKVADRKAPTLAVGLMIGAAGLGLFFLVALGWAYAAEAYVWANVPAESVPHDVLPPLTVAFVLAVLMGVAGWNLDVLNLSSLHPFYSARLARAYLGPGNPNRHIPWGSAATRGDHEIVPVRYPNDAIPGWMVIVKPRLPAHLPVDLARYAEREVDFPQQTTVDQFYDEAQWESTHKLGCIVGAQLAQVLSVLPAWLPGATPAPTHFRGAPLVTRLPEVAEAASSETRSGGQSSLIKVYAPLFIALWTGFEFYSNYKRDQEKDLVDATKFVLSRLDNLERRVFSPGGCSSKTASADDCSTVPMQAAYIRRILVELPSASAKPLLEITDRIEAALNLGRPHETNLAGSAEASATATAQLDQTGEPDPTPTSPPSVAQDALIYVQIYDEKRRASADGMVQALREAGFSAHQLPGVENVTKTARAKEMEPPIPFKAPTVVYFSDGDRPLADWLVQRLTYRKEGRAVSLNLSKQYPHVKRGLVEIWLP